MPPSAKRIKSEPAGRPVHMSSSSRVSLSAVTQELESLTDEERAALRASRFHSAPAPKSPERRCRLAHPGGPLATNKAAALAKFLKRKLAQDGAASLDPALVERAVENAKGRSVAVAKVRHVDSFSDSDENQANRSSKKLNHGSGTSGPRKKLKKKAPKLLIADQPMSLKTKGKKKLKKKKS
ncbi:unnamed protein product [Calypogeia fissa]